MQYQIIPLELGSIVEREVFQSDNMEIKCGLVWKLGSVVTEHKPTFLKNYLPHIGICIADIKGAQIADPRVLVRQNAQTLFLIMAFSSRRLRHSSHFQRPWKQEA